MTAGWRFTNREPFVWADNPKTSVLNKYCQAHDVKNLFVTDAAAFVTSPDKNPTLSILALSWRASEYLLEQAKRGNLNAKNLKGTRGAPLMFISRRDLIKSLSFTAAAGSMLRAVPFAAAEKAHRMVSAHKVASPSGEYAPKFFPNVSTRRCKPCAGRSSSDQESGGAIEAGAPEFIDLLSSENEYSNFNSGAGSCGLTRSAWSATGRPTCNVLGAADRDAGSHRLPQERTQRLQAHSRYRVLLDAAQIHGGRIFHQRNWNRLLGYIGNTYLKEFPAAPQYQKPSADLSSLKEQGRDCVQPC